MNPAPTSRHWHASLTLGFTLDQDTTRLTERCHSGPLRVQKALYPEGAAICHAIIVHPPGGVVGGDQLALAARVEAGAHALLTTPGAGKWYKANGHVSRQQITLDVGAAAKLEWLPQETIFFDAASVALQQTITLAADARYIGWEILCFGRTASGELFASGQLRQHTRITRASRLIWFEQGGVQAGAGGALHNPLGMQGKTVCATLIAVGPPMSSEQLTALRAAVAELLGAHARSDGGPDAAAEFGVSQSKAVLVARILCDSSELARHVMIETWCHVRPVVIGCAASVPRIWNT